MFFPINVNTRWAGIDVKSINDIAINAEGYNEGIHVKARHELGSIGIYATGDVGVSGVGDAADSEGTGVYGEGGIGVIGQSNGYLIGDPIYSMGVHGQNSSEGIGVLGNSKGIGVFGASSNSYGIFGRTNNPNSYAGYFEGMVNATGGYFSASDGKLKQNITELNSAMDLISKLQPKAYEYKQEGSYKLMNLPKGKHFGLIAQEVEEVLPELVNETQFDTRLWHLPVVKEPGSKQVVQNTTQQTAEKIDYKTVNYTELIPIMVKAMQEQQQVINQQQHQIEELRKQNKVLEDRLQNIETSVSNRSNNDLLINASSAYLEQSTPNPAGSVTLIRYYVPQNSGRTHILFTDIKGAIIKSITLSQKGTGQLSVNTATWAAGIYTYTLYVSDIRADSKKLVIAR